MEFCDRRFLWAQRKLREYEKNYSSIFPPSWHMNEKLMEAFAKRTSEQFSTILEKSEPEVKVLLHAIRETLKWENEMCSHFAKQPMMNDNSNHSHSDQEEDDEDEEEDDEEEENPQSAAAIQKRYRKFQKQRERKERKNNPTIQLEKKFKGIISSTFDKYTKIYINQEDILMNQKLDSILAEETWEISDDARNKVLRSSTDLIFYFKKSMKRFVVLFTFLFSFSYCFCCCCCLF